MVKMAKMRTGKAVAEKICSGFLRDTPGKWLPCLHEQTFDGQRSSSSLCCEMSEVSRIGREGFSVR